MPTLSSAERAWENVTRLVIAGTFLGAVGCMPEYRGEAVGSFQVTGLLVANDCGVEAVPALAEISFPIELRNDRGQALYRRPDAPLKSGRITEDGHYAFRDTGRLIVDADTPNGHVSCSLLQTDELTLELVANRFTRDAGSIDGAMLDGAMLDGAMLDGAMLDGAMLDAGSIDAGSIDGGMQVAPEVRGRHVIEFSAETALACQPLLVGLGGPWRALPCRVEYALAGARREPF